MIARKTNKIPARDGADSIPPALGVETSPRVPPCSARAPRQSSTDCRGNSHNVISDPCAINAKGRDPFRDDLADQARLVFVGVTIPGLGGRGVVALPFVYQPFHRSIYGD